MGSLITTVTRTFTIPFRPSSDTANCGPSAQTFLYNGVCVHGLPWNVTFPLGDTVAPNDVIWGIEYNTSHYGPSPYGELTTCYSNENNPPYNQCGYDSLNLGFTDANGPSVGTDPIPGTLYQNAVYSSDYCDNGTAGTFRLDSADGNGAPCYGVNTSSSAPWYIPAAQFNAVPEISVGSSNTTSIIGHSVTFTVTGPPTATHSVTVLDGSHAIGSCALSGGSCTVSTSTLLGGNHTITASYGGEGAFPAFTSAAITQSILTVSSRPNGPTAVPGNHSATISWSPPSNNGGTPITGYTVTASPGGATCSTSGATSCSISGLTDGTPYTFAVTATNLVGTSFSATTPQVIPATTGYHVYASPSVVENHKVVSITATGAQADSLLILSVAGHGTKHVFADAYGAGAVHFTISQSGKYAISATNNNAIAHGTLYVAHVTMPAQATHIHQVPITVRNAIPGSVVVVATSDDGTYSVPVPSNRQVTIDLPPPPRGTMNVTVTDAGFQVVKRPITIS